MIILYITQRGEEPNGSDLMIYIMEELMVESTNQSNGSNPFDTIRSIYIRGGMNGRDSTNGSLSILRGAIHTQQYTYNIVWEGMDESMNGMDHNKQQVQYVVQ